jgi:soluble lytic murein transglycosylase
MTGSRSFTAALLLFGAAFGNTATGQSDDLRQAWLEARRAIVRSNAQLPTQRSLRRYALYPYLEAAAIIQRMRSAREAAQAIADARGFLEAHADTALAETFRRDLLLALSERHAWEDFVAFYDPDVANESRQCEYLRARVVLGLTENLADAIEQRWLTPRRLDSACEPAFRWHRQNGGLGADLTAQRLVLLLENGETEFARIIAARLPDEQAEIYRQWAWMLENPLDALDQVSTGALEPLHADALPMTFARASIRSPEAAFDRLDNLTAVIGADSSAARQMLRDLALGLAWDRSPLALDAFARMRPTEHDDYSLGWLVRSATWNMQWALAHTALAALSADTAQESTWAYWQARTALELGRADEAAGHFAALLRRDNYYSAMAAARLGRPLMPNNQPIVPPPTLMRDLADEIEFIRARELFYVGERIAATREWRYATRDLNVQQLSAAMYLAAQWGWHDMAVATATRAEVFFDYRLLYPLPFTNEIAAAAASHSLDHALLGGLIRQESMFRPDAVSSAGAIGLTQLRPSTARRIAARAGMTQPDRTELFEPAANTRLGAATLRASLGRFDDQLPVALAAYNAGPAAAARWLPNQAIDSDIWIENIPYNETRDYVQRVLWNTVVYAWLLSNEMPVNTEYLLGAITQSTVTDN